MLILCEIILVSENVRNTVVSRFQFVENMWGGGGKLKTAFLMCIVLPPKSGALLLLLLFLAEPIFMNKKVSHIFLDRCLILFSVCVCFASNNVYATCT